MRIRGCPLRRVSSVYDYAFTVTTYVGLDDPEDTRADLNKMDDLATMTG